MTDRRVRESDELIELLGVPVLGRIPEAKTAPGRALLAYTAPAAGRT
jgi:hypothetical protein